MEDLIELDRRISKGIAKGKGIRFSDAELDLLVSVGAIEVLKKATAEAMKAQADAPRLAREGQRSEVAAPVRGRPIEASPSDEEVGAATRRAQRVSRPRR